jgi:ankyrin repeat protein
MSDCAPVATSIAKLIQRIVIVFILAALAGAQQSASTEQEISSGRIIRDQAQAELHRQGVEFNASSFLKSVDEEKAELVNLFLVAGMDPNSNEAGGTTALMIAAGLRRSSPNTGGGCIDGIVHPCYLIARKTAPADLEIVRLLIKAGAAVQARDVDGETALHKAAAASNVDIAKILIHQGAEVNATSTRRATPLTLAALTNDDTIMVELLFANGAAVNDLETHSSPALLNAAAAGHLGSLRFLISKGADASSTNRAGTTALMEAATHGHAETVEFLLDGGAKIDVQDTGGYSALMYAAFNGQTDIVKLLLKRGANKTLTNGKGETAGAIAAKRNFASTARLLE